jgi:DNA-binding MarR family transcriptional regulator
MTSTNQQSLSENETDALATIYSVLDSFHTLSRKMPISFARAFLAVCLHPNRCVEELARECGTSNAVMSRMLGDIGACNRYHKPGMGLVEVAGDPMDRRLVLMRPSYRGAALARQMVGAMKRRQHLAAT